MSLRRLLVTGGAGFIGSTFLERITAAGLDAVVLDRLTYAGHRENLAGVRGPGRCTLVVGDIRDGRLVRELLTAHAVDAIVNFAAESHVDRSIDAPAEFIGTNVVGTYTLLECALEYWRALPAERAAAFRYLQISTDEVYGSLGPEGRFSERSPYEPNSPYSASKAGADHLVRAWHHTFGLPTLTTHASNNYGPRQFPEKLIPRMIACALAEQPLPVYGDGLNVRDWLHVADHCDGVLAALRRGRPGGTYCFGGDAERTNLDLVHTVCRHLDALRPRPGGGRHADLITFVQDRLGHDRRYAIDASLAHAELGWRPAHDFDTGLHATVRWYLDNVQWAAAVTAPRPAEGAPHAAGGSTRSAAGSTPPAEGSTR